MNPEDSLLLPIYLSSGQHVQQRGNYMGGALQLHRVTRLEAAEARADGDVLM